ncbi:MAG: hypothetical protein IH616_04780 [Gemmatimonadales bacterium]|nr:hypothetical protein [Gemmatimonadales bacterium]
MSNCFRHPALARPTIFCFLLAVGGSGTVLGQIGYEPTSSPYHDLTTKYMISATAGYSWGGGGRVAVGPGNGPVYGGRVDVHLAGPGTAQFGINVGSLDRVLIDPTQGPDDRVLGTVKQSVIMAEVGLNLVLTGAKTWHGFAPYIGVALGLGIGGDVPADSLSGYEFNLKFLADPQIGVRWHVTRNLSFRFEGRDVIWKLSYPDRFFNAPPDFPDSPVLDPQFVKKTQWTHNPMLLFSVGYAFGR